MERNTDYEHPHYAVFPNWFLKKSPVLDKYTYLPQHTVFQKPQPVLFPFCWSPGYIKQQSCSAVCFKSLHF